MAAGARLATLETELSPLSYTTLSPLSYTTSLDVTSGALPLSTQGYAARLFGRS